jgi:Tfp pilus assembly protein PilF
MTFMFERPICAIAVAALSALALVSCSPDQSAESHSDISGSDLFLEMVEDARISVRDGNLAEAGRLLDEARALEPENPGLWVDIARLRFRGGQNLAAIEAADYALQLDPQYAPALLMRAQLVRDANGLAEALPWYEAAAIADPRNAEVVADYAATLGDLGRYRDMLSVVYELAEFAPGYPAVHYLQAVLAARAEDPVLASNLLDRSGLNDAGVPAAMMLDAIIDLQQSNYDTAAQTLDRLAQRQPGNVRVRELLARALWLGGRDRALVDRFEARAESDGASPYLVMMVGRSLERMGDRARAAVFIERARAQRGDGWFVLDSAAERDGGLPAATLELRNFVSAGNAGSAQALGDDLLRQFPGSSDMHALAGDAALARGDARRALELYEVAARVRRPWPLTRKIIAAYRAYDDHDAADALLARHIAGDPHNTSALLSLAQRSAADEDWLRVVVLLDTAIRLGAGSDLEVLTLRVKAARALGNEREAEGLDMLLTILKPGVFAQS